MSHPARHAVFTDAAEPAYGNMAISIPIWPMPLLTGTEGYQGYGSCQPGVPFAFGFDAVKSHSGEEDGRFFVDISAVIPDKTSDYPSPAA